MKYGIKIITRLYKFTRIYHSEKQHIRFDPWAATFLRWSYCWYGCFGTHKCCLCLWPRCVAWRDHMVWHGWKTGCCCESSYMTTCLFLFTKIFFLVEKTMTLYILIWKTRRSEPRAQFFRIMCPVESVGGTSSRIFLTQWPLGFSVALTANALSLSRRFREFLWSQMCRQIHQF